MPKVERRQKRVGIKWFSPGVHMGWHKDDGQATRRRAALKAHGGDALATARALMAISNGSQDAETHRKARADSLYFYQVHKRRG